MDLTALECAMSVLETRASERGFFNPRVEFHLNWISTGPRIKMGLNVTADGNTSYPDFSFERGGFQSPFEVSEIAAILDDAHSWLEAQDNPEKLRREKFQKTLASLIEEGRDLEMPIVADLEATMKRLSENIIEFHGSAA